MREATNTGTSHETASVLLLLQTCMASPALQDDGDRLRTYELAVFCNHDSCWAQANPCSAGRVGHTHTPTHTHTHVPHLASQLLGFHRARGLWAWSCDTDMYTLNFVSAQTRLSSSMRQISSPAHHKPGSAQQLGGENVSSCILLCTLQCKQVVLYRSMCLPSPFSST